MNRRDFISGIGSAAAMAPLLVFDSPKPVAPNIGLDSYVRDVDGLWIGTGSVAGEGPTYILTSPDGVNWTRRDGIQ